MEEAVEFSARIRIHRDTLERALFKRIDDIEKKALSDAVRKRAAEIYLDCVEPLVPKKLGDLRKSAYVPDKKYKGDYSVVYDIDYAKAQYEGYNGRGPHKKWTTTGTTDHWNHHLTTADRQAFYDLVAEEIKEGIKHG